MRSGCAGAARIDVPLLDVGPNDWDPDASDADEGGEVVDEVEVLDDADAVESLWDAAGSHAPCRNEPLTRTCPAGEFCSYTAWCGPFADGGCVVPVTACPPGGEPVCACDGLTYASACERIRLRLGRQHFGRCGPGEDIPFCGVEPYAHAPGWYWGPDMYSESMVCYARCDVCAVVCRTEGPAGEGW